MNKPVSITKEYAVTLIGEKYGISPEYPWLAHPNYAVFRHGDNKKWFAVLMQVAGDSIGIDHLSSTFIINLKCDPLSIGSFLKEDGILPSFHMNHQNWVSVLLDGSVDPDLFAALLDMSFSSTASGRRKHQNKSGICEWIIPANPKYYDIVGAFEHNSEINWKQSSNVKPGDILYMYVAAPYSAIMYKCEAVEVDIPYTFKGKINISKVMRIKLLEKYDPRILTFSLLNRYGVRAVRGPRSMPVSLKDDIKFLTGGCVPDETI